MTVSLERPDAAGGSRRLSRTERTIAQRMVESCRDVPTFTVSAGVHADAMLTLRAMLREQDAQPLPSLNDMVVRACAIALRRHPRLNASYRDGHIDYQDHVHVGVAVASDDSLLVPVVRNADALSLADVATETRALIAAARARSLSPEQMNGGTFTVSNLGMLGVDRFTAIVQQPQAAILAVGAVRSELARRGEEIVDHTTCELTMTCDHRIVYGAHAAPFLGSVRELLEQPERLVGV